MEALINFIEISAMLSFLLFIAVILFIVCVDKTLRFCVHVKHKEEDPKPGDVWIRGTRQLYVVGVYEHSIVMSDKPKWLAGDRTTWAEPWDEWYKSVSREWMFKLNQGEVNE